MLTFTLKSFICSSCQIFLIIPFFIKESWLLESQILQTNLSHPFVSNYDQA